MTRNMPPRRPIRLGGDSDDGTLSVRVPNAGVVLLWPFLQHYFETLGLMQGGRFVDAVANHRAVRLVHWLASGQWAQEEIVLPLAKVLCGLVPDTTLLPSGDAPTERERALCNALLNAVIQSWAQLRNTSIDGLRDNFLMRDGVLARSGAGAAWHLHVQRRAFDELLALLPWSPVTIRLEWMPQPLQARWS